MNGRLSRNRAGRNFVCKGREKCAEIDFFGAVWYNKGKQESNTALSAKSEFAGSADSRDSKAFRKRYARLSVCLFPEADCCKSEFAGSARCRYSKAFRKRYAHLSVHLFPEADCCKSEFICQQPRHPKHWRDLL